MWKSIPCKIAEVRLDRTLACGQSFRWKEQSQGLWTGVIGRNVWRLKQTDTDLYYQVFAADSIASQKEDVKDVKVGITGSNAHGSKKKWTKPSSNIPIWSSQGCLKQEPESVKQETTDEDIIRDYFHLHINLTNLYKTWSEADSHFQKISKEFTGIRIIRQNPVECLISFICSSNNNISRITSMIDNLTKHFGEKILDLEGYTYYSFPTVESLSVDGVEETLRGLGFGYRAKYIQASARYIEKHGGEDWLYSLRTMDYKAAKSELMKLYGVGAKVADCVGLFCLDKHGAIPVDTHVWQIASRDYIPKLKQSKSLTDKLYDEIGEFFRELWGPYAGWAHSVLFTADLRQFKDVSGKSPSKRKQIKSESMIEENSKRKNKRK